jgi:hypothetical protein
VAGKRVAQPVYPQLRKYACVPALTFRATFGNAPLRDSILLLIRRHFRSQRCAGNPYFMRVTELHVSSKIPTTQ